MSFSIVSVVLITSLFGNGECRSVASISTSSRHRNNLTVIGNIRWNNEGFANWNKPKKVQDTRLQYMKECMDETVDPCDDFYQYACGNWERINLNPKNFTKHSTIEVLHRRKMFALKKVLLSKSDRSKSDRLKSDRSKENESESEAMAKMFYQSCVNLEQLRAAGSQPLIEFLSNFAVWPAFSNNWSKNSFDWINVTANAKLFDTNVFFTEVVDVDYENEFTYLIYLDQAVLPYDRSYMDGDPELYEENYNKTMQKILRRLGLSKKMVIELAREITDFELKLFNMSSREHERQDTLRYRRMRLSQLHDEIPEVDWQRFLSIAQNRTVNFSETIIVKEFDYLQNLGRLIANTNLRSLANYIFWRLALKYTSYTHLAATLTKNVYEWWTFCVSEVTKSMKSPVNALFIKNYFNANAKYEVLKIIDEIQQVTHDAILRTHWLDNDVKYEAIRKLATMSIKVGYPDYILEPKELDKEFAGVHLDGRNFFTNAVQLSFNLNRIQQGKTGTVVSKTEWFKSPIEVGAFLEFQRKGELIVPAGILQSPVYSEHVPRAINYGSIGTIIGHELMHAFDVGSIIYVGDDYTSDLWTPDIDREYNLHVECYLEQYNQYRFPDIDKHVDGDQTLMENIVDNDGLKVAFKAYKKWAEQYSGSNEDTDDLELTNLQAFFVSFAQNWCDSSDPSQVLKQIETDEHSPERFRAIGALSNFEDFSKEFNCPLGSPMNPVQKCSFLSI